jgi:hypothetical protein
MLAGCEQENRPVLKVVIDLRIYFAVEALRDLFGRKRAAYESRDGGISPNRQSEREIVFGPMAETEARRFQEIGIGAWHRTDHYFNAECFTTHIDMSSNASGANVSSMFPYSEGEPVALCWKRWFRPGISMV